MRKINWQQQLDDYIESVRKTAYTIGKFDCVLFVADAIQVMTGEDIAADVRGKYTTEAEAYSLLAKHGGFETALTDIFGPMLGRNNASKGDVVLYGPFDDERPAIGICLGTLFASPGDSGLLFKPMRSAQASWSVK